MGTRPTSVLITGTTSGIGRALLDHYVSAGARVIAVNRRREEALESRYPQVRFAVADVRSAEAVGTLVRTLADEGALPEVFLLNAGINRVDNDEYFRLPEYREVMETNLFGVLNFVGPLTALPVAQPLHLVAISSMASYAGNPYGLGYHTSKKSLSACFDVWARMYAGTDLVFQRVMLGPVRTAMFTMEDKLPPYLVWTKRFFSASLDGTARAIARFARTKRKSLLFPLSAFPLFVAMWVGRRLLPGFLHGRRTLDGRSRRRGDR